jgi:hypothetical protein
MDNRVNLKIEVKDLIELLNIIYYQYNGIPGVEDINLIENSVKNIKRYLEYCEEEANYLQE